MTKKKKESEKEEIQELDNKIENNEPKKLEIGTYKTDIIEKIE